VSFRVRRARPGEEEALLPMYEWLFAPPGSMPPAWDEQRALEALGEALADPRSAVFVAESGADAALAGICTAYLELRSVRFGQRCWVEDLAVDPAQRSRGIGAALLDAASDWARDAGATHLELDTGEARADAQRFYERRGPAWRSISYAWLL
jgi:GNAT superfamily N-acetyltransferase